MEVPSEKVIVLLRERSQKVQKNRKKVISLRARNSGRVNPFPEANSHFNVSVNGSRLSSLFLNLLFFCIMLQSHINITEGRMDE